MAVDKRARASYTGVMADYIYASDGEPRGYRLSNFIYALDGVPLGRVFAEKAYRFDGTYAGALINNMVVDKPDVSKRSIPAAAPPPAMAPVRGAETRRPIGTYYADCFERLLSPAAAETF